MRLILTMTVAINECVLASTSRKVSFWLDTVKILSTFMKQLVPDLGTISLPQNYNVYKYKKPKTNNELLHYDKES